MSDDRPIDLYGLIDGWLGLGVEHQSYDRLLLLGPTRFEDLLQCYVAAREYDERCNRTLGLALGDCAGEVHIQIPRMREGEADGWQEPDRDALRRAFLYAHGIVLDSHLMHYIAVGRYDLAARELHLMGEFRALERVGVVRWRESPTLSSKYLRALDGTVRRHSDGPDDWWRFIIQPGLFEPGSHRSDFARMSMESFRQMGELLQTLHRMAPLGLASLGAPTRSDGNLIGVWLRHLATCSWPDEKRIHWEAKELTRLVSRFPVLLDGEVPMGQPEVLTLFRLPVDDMRLSLSDVLALREQSDRFRDWRLGLHQALREVGETGSLMSSEQWEATAATIMRDHLAPKAARLKSEMRQSCPVAGMTSVIISTIAMTAGTAAAGGSIIEAASGGIGGAFSGLAAAAYQRRRDNPAMRAELAHFMAFAS